MFGQVQANRADASEVDRSLADAPTWIAFPDKEEEDVAAPRDYYFSPSEKRVVFEPIPNGAVRYDGTKHKRFMGLANTSANVARRSKKAKIKIALTYMEKHDFESAAKNMDKVIPRPPPPPPPPQRPSSLAPATTPK